MASLIRRRALRTRLTITFMVDCLWMSSAESGMLYYGDANEFAALIMRLFSISPRTAGDPIIGTSSFINLSARDLVLFDRDDTLIFDLPERIRSVADLTATPGAFSVLERLSRRDCSVGIVSNQSAVDRGLVSYDQLVDIMEHLAREVFSGRDGEPLFQFWIACPHLPGVNCICRKPKPKMILDALALHHSLERVVFVGDQLSDIEAARAAGIASLRLSGRLRAEMIEAALAARLS